MLLELLQWLAQDIRAFNVFNYLLRRRWRSAWPRGLG